MPLSTSLGTYDGRGVPLDGESELRAGTGSTGDMQTLTMSSTPGAALVVRTDIPRGSTVQTADIVRISSAGGYAVVSGTTSLMELNSSGLYVNSESVLSSLRGFAGKSQRVTINTTGSTLVSSNSGKIHILSTAAASSNFINLPTSGSVQAGDYWDILSDTTGAGIWNVVIVGANTGGTIAAHVGTTGAITTTGALENLTSGMMWWRIICVSTTPIYALSNMMTPSGLPTTNSYTAAPGPGTTAT